MELNKNRFEEFWVTCECDPTGDAKFLVVPFRNNVKMHITSLCMKGKKQEEVSGPAYLLDLVAWNLKYAIKKLEGVFEIDSDGNSTEMTLELEDVTIGKKTHTRLTEDCYDAIEEDILMEMMKICQTMTDPTAEEEEQIKNGSNSSTESQDSTAPETSTALAEEVTSPG